MNSSSGPALAKEATKTQLPTPSSNALSNSQSIDIQQLTASLADFLNNAELPLTFSAPVENLIKRLRIAETAEEYQSCMDDLLCLWQQVQAYQQAEQQAVINVCSDLNEKLLSLGLQTAGSSADAPLLTQMQAQLTASIAREMPALGANTLATIKRTLSSNIDTLCKTIAPIKEQNSAAQLEELTLKVAQLDEECKELKNKLTVAYSKATRDSLTNLPNRLAYEENLGYEIARWKRYQNSFSLVIWDIDFFKHVNDTYGHHAGDKALIQIANLLVKHCRAADFVARIGGEEFVMVLPNTDEQSTLVLANKIRETIAHTHFEAHGQTLFITVSCGISQFRAGDDGEKLFERTDQALYTAKSNGRNQCVLGS